jgi:hypothetical protein
MNRRSFLAACSIAALGSVAGCVIQGGVTDSLLTKANAHDYRDYTETVDHILITTDGKKIIFIGPTYHYIFDAPEHFQELLASPLHAKMTAEFLNFMVYPSSAVQGTIKLKLEKPDQNDQALMQTYGFTGADKKVIELRGTRYNAGNFEMPSNLQPLNQPYQVAVTEQLSTQSKKPLVLLTPLALAADGVLVLIGVPVMAILCLTTSSGWPLCQ